MTKHQQNVIASWKQELTRDKQLQQPKASPETIRRAGDAFRRMQRTFAR